MSRFGCAICSEVLDENRDISATKCGHVFHAICLRKWLSSNATCPHCRTTTRLARDVIEKIFFTNHDETICMTPGASSGSNDECQRLREKCRRMKSGKADMKDQIEALQALRTSYVADNAKLEVDIKKLKTDLKCQLAEVKRLQKTASTLAAENTKLRSSLNELQHFRVIMTGKEEEVKAILSSYGATYSTNQPAVELAQFCAELKGQLSKIMMEKTRLLKQLDTAYQQKVGYQNEVISNRDKIGKLKERIEHLERVSSDKLRTSKRGRTLQLDEQEQHVTSVHSSPNRSVDMECSENFCREEDKSDAACALQKPVKSSYRHKLTLLSNTSDASHTQTYDGSRLFRHKTDFSKYGIVKKPKPDEAYNGLGGHSGPPDFHFLVKRSSSPRESKQSVKRNATLASWLQDPSVLCISDSESDS